MPNDVINQITIKGTTYDINGGGHVIENSDGTDMTQRSNLQFLDAGVSDDPTNNRTKIENVQVIDDEDELDDAPDGMYMGSYDDADIVTDASNIGYDNTESGLESNNVQSAIDEVVNDLSNKVDKVTSATNGNLAGLNGSGNLTDSGVAANNVVKKSGDTMTGSLAIVSPQNTIKYLSLQSDTKENVGRATTFIQKNASASVDNGTYLVDLGWGESTKRTSLTIRDVAGLTDKLNLKVKDSNGTETNYKVFGEHNSNAYDNTDKAKVGKIDETTTSISGNPISISGLKSNQLAVNPIVTLEPIQAGSGTPSPSNIRAISGYDKVEVESCGKNIFDGTFQKAVLTSGTTWNANSSCRTAIVRIKANTIFAVYKNGGNRFYIAEANEYPVENGVYTLLHDGGSATTGTGIIQTSSNAKYLLIYCTNDNTDNIQLQVEESESATTYVPYNKTTSISESLGRAVYWGELDVRSGKFKVIGKIIDLGDLVWIYNSTYDKFYAQTVTDALKAEGKTCVCSRYLAVDNINTIAGTMPDKSICMMSDATNPNSRIFIYDTDYDDGTTLQTALVGTQFVYKLATPFTIQLTPHEISLLKDYAYVSTNGTTIALDYHNGELASLSDVSQLGETVNDGLNYLQRNNGQSGTAYVDISSYNSATNKYIFPNDGYVYFSSQGVSTGTVEIPLYGANDIQVGRIRKNISATYQDELIFVRKGMKCCVTNKPNNTFTHFYPLV